jgi:hypothetical protein
MEKPKVEMFPNDAIVSIKVSGAFYKRLVKLMFSLSTQQDLKSFIKVMTELKTREPENDEEFNIMTVLIMIAEIEKQVKDTGAFEVVDAPIPDQETPDEDSE